MGVSDSLDRYPDPASDASGSSNNIQVFNRCDSNWPTTLFTFLNIHGELTLEPLRSGHRLGLWFRALLFFYRFTARPISDRHF